MSNIKKDSSVPSFSSGDASFRSFFVHFFKNEHHTFVVQKTEKLASALYVVTNHMSDGEPLRTRLRTCALDLVSSTTDIDRAHGGRVHERFGSRCLEIGTILKLAERAGLISPMNATVLCEEYGHLASFVREHRDTIFSRLIDIGGTKSPPYDSQNRGSEDGHKGQLKDINSNNNKRHSHRQNLILDLLAKKDKITVKEAKASIIGCSEKTVQREIMSLVEDGVLIKEGERRWSTYRKANQLLNPSRSALV